jgi:hypothetical protein
LSIYDEKKRKSNHNDCDLDFGGHTDLYKSHSLCDNRTSMLFSDLYYSDPIDLGETKEHADELSVLLQVTSYDEIPHFNDIANKLIEISKNVESRPAFSEQTIELFQSFIYNLGKPLSDDIDTLSTSLYESIMSESVEG